jgi:Ca-activated chloride channel homolog
MIFLEPLALFLLPAPALLWLYLRGRLKANRAWRAEWAASSPRLEFLRPWLIGAAALFLVLALARPAWDPREASSSGMGQDAVFLVDVSRSMDTVDIDGSSRLVAVKRALLDLSSELSGDRAALVAFAGTTVVKCPLTGDLAFFRQAVQLLDTSSASRGGTLLGDALREVEKDFGSDGKDGRKISLWVFTDGGDQESFPAEAARELGKAGVSLRIWGVGSLAGGAVPERGVSSALNAELLSGVAAAAADGAYFGVDKPLWRLGTEYRLRHRALSRSGGSVTIWHEGAWWLLWPALACVLLEMSLGLDFGRKRRPK